MPEELTPALEYKLRALGIDPKKVRVLGPVDQFKDAIEEEKEQPSLRPTVSAPGVNSQVLNPLEQINLERRDIELPRVLQNIETEPPDAVQTGLQEMGRAFRAHPTLPRVSTEELESSFGWSRPTSEKVSGIQSGLMETVEPFLTAENALILHGLGGLGPLGQRIAAGLFSGLFTAGASQSAGRMASGTLGPSEQYEAGTELIGTGLLGTLASKRAFRKGFTGELQAARLEAQRAKAIKLRAENIDKIKEHRKLDIDVESNVIPDVPLKSSEQAKSEQLAFDLAENYEPPQQPWLATDIRGRYLVPYSEVVKKLKEVTPIMLHEKRTAFSERIEREFLHDKYKQVEGHDVPITTRFEGGREREIKLNALQEKLAERVAREKAREEPFKPATKTALEAALEQGGKTPTRQEPEIVRPPTEEQKLVEGIEARGEPGTDLFSSVENPPIIIEHRPPGVRLKTAVEKFTEPTKKEILYPDELKTKTEKLKSGIQKKQTGEEIKILGESEPKKIVTPVPKIESEIVKPSFEEKPSHELPRELPSKYAEETLPEQKLGRITRESVLTSEVQKELRRRGFTQPEIDRMPVEFGNKIYENLIHEPLKLLSEAAKKKLKSSIEVSSGKSQKGLKINYGNKEGGFINPEILKEIKDLVSKGVKEVPKSLLLGSRDISKELKDYVRDNFKKSSVINLNDIYDKELGNKKESSSSSSSEKSLEKESLKKESLEKESLEKESPTLQEGERLVTVQRPDGSTYKASFGDKYWELGNKKVPSIGKIVENKWSHGMLGEGEKIIEEVEKRYSGLPPDLIPSSLGRLKPQIDKLRNSPLGNYVANGLEKTYQHIRNYVGEYSNTWENSYLKNLPSKSEKAFGTLSEENQKLLDDYFIKRKRGETTLPILSKPLNNIVKAWDDLSLQVYERHKSIGIPFAGEGIAMPEKYYPEKIRSEIVDNLLRFPNSSESSKIKKDFIDLWSKNISIDKAEKNYQEMLDSFKSTENVNRASFFGPIDSARGLGVPDSAREKNPLTAIDSYLKRIGRRFAHAEVIESDPALAKALGLKLGVTKEKLPDDIILPTGEKVETFNHPDLEPIIKDIQGRFSRSDAAYEAAGRVVKSLMLQVLTGSIDISTSQFLGYPFMSLSQLPKAMIKPWINVRQGIAESVAKGVNRLNIGAIEFRDFGEGSIIGTLHNTSNAINKTMARSFLERIVRGRVWEEGKYVAENHIWRLHSKSKNILWSSKQAEHFFNTFAKDLSWRDWIKDGVIPPEAMKEIAARYVERGQGTYNYSGLPRLTQDSKLSPILSLSRWTVERANNWMRDVWKPAIKDGNYRPFFMDVIGTIFGSIVANEVRKVIGRIHSKIPSFKEIEYAKEVGSEDYEDMVKYKMAGIIQAGEHLGIIGDLYKGIWDIRFKNAPRSINDPAIEFLKNNIQRLGHIWEAIDEPIKLLDVLGVLMEDNIQNYRLLHNWISDTGIKEVDAMKMARDYKVYKQIHDQYVNWGMFGGGKINPFLDADIRHFKEEVDPKLIAKYFKIIDERLEMITDPEEKDRLLRKLQTIAVPHAPSMKSNPEEFQRYLMFLNKTQGTKAAKDFLNKYEEKSEAADFKRNLFPKPLR